MTDDLPADVPDRIEHTVLGPRTTWAAVQTVLDDAIRDGMRACVPPAYLGDAVAYAPGVDVATVVAFPHGQEAVDVVVTAARRAAETGAAEVDLVANQGLLVTGDDDAYEAAIAEVVAAVPVPVKVIVEAPSLSAGELERACERVAAADAAFLKTATGFGEGGATVADVETMAAYRPVKASGGVGSWAQARRMFEAGAARIGASSGATIVQEYRAATGTEN